MDHEEYKDENGLMESDRVLTVHEEHVYRLIHHDFAGLTQEEAAELLNISQSEVSRTVSHLRDKAPQLFPILTRLQVHVRGFILEQGFTHQQIAEAMGTSEGTVDSIVATLKDKGVCFEKPIGKTVQYTEGMDGDVTEKF